MRKWACLLSACSIAACTGAAPPEAPKPAPRPSVVVVPPAPPPAPTVAPRKEPVRVAIGSAFDVDPEEPLPAGAVARCGTTRMRAASPGKVAISNTGSIWALDQPGSGWVLRDVTRGIDVAELPGGSHAAFAPDASFLAVESDRKPGLIVFFSVPGGARLGEVKVPLPQKPAAGRRGLFDRYTRVKDLAVSPDGGAVVVTTSDDAAHVIDPVKQKLVKTVRIPPKSRLAGLGSGAKRAVFEILERESLFSLSYGSLEGYAVIDLQSGAAVRRDTFKKPPPDPLDPHAARTPDHAYASFRLSLDGNKVYRAESGEITAIHVATGKESEVKKRPRSSGIGLGFSGFGLGGMFGAARRFQILPDGRHAVLDGDVVDLIDPSASPAIKGDFEAISANGEWTVKREGSRFVRSPEDPELRPGHDTAVTSLAFLPNNHLVSVASRPISWDTTSCEPTWRPAQPASFVAAATRKEVSFLDGAQAVIVDGAHATRKVDVDGRIETAAFSPEGDTLYLGTGDHVAGPGSVVALDLADPSSPRRQERPFPSPVQSLAVAPDGGALAIVTGELHGQDPGSIHLLSPAGLSTSAQADVAEPGTVAFAGANRLVHSIHRGGVSVRSIPSLDETARIHRRGCCRHTAVSADGKLVAGADDRSVFVWEIESRKLVGHIRGGHREPIESLAFSADDRFLATGSKDTTVLFWDLRKLTVPPLREKAETKVTVAAEAKLFMQAEWSYFRVAPDGSLVSPPPKLKVPPLKKVSRVASAIGAHCAVSEGKVRCWGSTRGGLLGIPEEPGKDKWTPRERPVPVTVPVNDPVDLRMSAWLACALERGGDLVCWGRLDREKPGAAPAKVLSGVKSFALNGYRLCAVGNDGVVRCSGEDDATLKPLPVQDAVSVAMGGFHTCVLDKGGAVRCTGDNDHDQLGDDTGLDRTGMVAAAGVQGAAAIAAGSYSTCALTTAAKVLCWGRLDGAHLPRPTPIAALDGSTAIRLDSESPCGLVGDQAVCVKLPAEPEP